jgi:hypothetical protein
MTGNDLLEACQSNAPDLGVCFGYIEAVADLGNSNGFHINGKSRCISISTRVTAGQARDLVVRFLTEHPAIRHYGAANLVVAALAPAFPCH